MRFLKIVSKIEIKTQQEITRDDLAKVKSGHIDSIIDLDNFTVFNAEENRWDKISQA